VPRQTQQALYETIALELSWSESELPQSERTKHVHGLHPYLGKFVPQLVEAFLQRYFAPGDCVFDPFAGSGTTLVEANAFGAAAIGCDISAFNCLLAEVKLRSYVPATLELALRGALEQSRRAAGNRSLRGVGSWLRRWYARAALRELLAYADAVGEIEDPEMRDVARVVLSRAARSARRARHFDLDFPSQAATAPHWCHKHRRTCVPVEEAAKFLRRYTGDTAKRLRAFASVRSPAPVDVIHGDARSIALPRGATGIITSPPYPGLIDYHEQHRYAYELLDLPDVREAEIGPGVRGTTRRAIEDYVEAISAAFNQARVSMPRGAPVVIVVNDRRELYPRILERSGLILEERLRRHVNRRTGRRAGEFFEDVLVCRTR
jgi:hypothetical protein